MVDSKMTGSAGSLTVDVGLETMEAILTKIGRDAEPLMTSTPSNGDTSSEKSLIAAMLLYWHAQAMAELAQLRFWLARNDYARSLTMKQICAGSGLISAEVMKLLDLLAMTRVYASFLAPYSEDGALDWVDDDDEPV